MAKTTSKPASSSKPAKTAAAKPAGTAAPRTGIAGTPTKAQERLATRAVVESDLRAKTRTVSLDFAAPHSKYGKIVRKKTSIQIHDEASESRKGDIVEIAPCRPVSKSKRWRLLRVVERRSVIDATIAAPSA